MWNPWNVTYEDSKGHEQTVSFIFGDAKKDAEDYAAAVGGHAWQCDRQLLDEAEAFVGKIPWLKDPSEYEAAADAAEKEAEDTEDVVLPAKKGEQPAAGSGARVKVSRLPDAGTLPPTKEVRVPDEELPKPRRRGGRPKKFTLDEEASDPLE